MGVRDKDIEVDIDIPDFNVAKCPHCGSSKFTISGKVELGAHVDVEYIEDEHTGAYEENIINMETANDQDPSQEQSVLKGTHVECYECGETIVD